MNYQTETTAKTGNYELSKLNACKWQTRREDIMACMGTRCPYFFCQHAEEELPPLGAECPWEIWYADKLVAQFDQLFPRDGIGEHMDDRPAHRKEWVLAHLLANRAGARAREAFNDAMVAVINRGNMPIDRRPFVHHALAERYRRAAYNRLERIWDQVPVIEKRLRDRRIIREMIMHGYWHTGDPAPNPEDAPQWIKVRVDGQRV